MVKDYAQRNNIGFVLRFNGDPINPNRREDVLRVWDRGRETRRGPGGRPTSAVRA